MQSQKHSNAKTALKNLHKNERKVLRHLNNKEIPFEITLDLSVFALFCRSYVLLLFARSTTGLEETEAYSCKKLN